VRTQTRVAAGCPLTPALAGCGTPWLPLPRCHKAGEVLASFCVQRASGAVSPGSLGPGPAFVRSLLAEVGPPRALPPQRTIRERQAVQGLILRGQTHGSLADLG